MLNPLLMCADQGCMTRIVTNNQPSFHPCLCHGQEAWNSRGTFNHTRCEKDHRRGSAMSERTRRGDSCWRGFGVSRSGVKRPPSERRELHISHTYLSLSNVTACHSSVCWHVMLRPRWGSAAFSKCPALNTRATSWLCNVLSLNTRVGCSHLCPPCSDSKGMRTYRSNLGEGSATQTEPHILVRTAGARDPSLSAQHVGGRVN